LGAAWQGFARLFPVDAEILFERASNGHKPPTEQKLPTGEKPAVGQKQPAGQKKVAAKSGRSARPAASS
jgi:hypothetical protein